MAPPPKKHARSDAEKNGGDAGGMRGGEGGGGVGKGFPGTQVTCGSRAMSPSAEKPKALLRSPYHEPGIFFIRSVTVFEATPPSIISEFHTSLMISGWSKCTVTSVGSTQVDTLACAWKLPVVLLSLLPLISDISLKSTPRGQVESSLDCERSEKHA